MLSMCIRVRRDLNIYPPWIGLEGDCQRRLILELHFISCIRSSQGIQVILYWTSCTSQQPKTPKKFGCVLVNYSHQPSTFRRMKCCWCKTWEFQCLYIDIYMHVSFIPLSSTPQGKTIHLQACWNMVRDTPLKSCVVWLMIRSMFLVGRDVSFGALWRRRRRSERHGHQRWQPHLEGAASSWTCNWCNQNHVPAQRRRRVDRPVGRRRRAVVRGKATIPTHGCRLLLLLLLLNSSDHYMAGLCSSTWMMMNPWDP